MFWSLCIFIATQWASRERDACPISQIQKLISRDVNDSLFTHTVWLSPEGSHYIVTSLKHKISSLATKIITRLLFVKGFVFMEYFSINIYWSFFNMAMRWSKLTLYFPEGETVVQKAYSSHVVGMSTTTKAQSRTLSIPACSPRPRDQRPRHECLNLFGPLFLNSLGLFPQYSSSIFIKT